MTSVNFDRPSIVKLGNPVCARHLGNVPATIMTRLRDEVAKYDFTSEQYVTTERSFKGTRRVVARDPRHKNKEQVYATADFDDNLMRITAEVRGFIEFYFLPKSIPVLVQLACLMPGQRLEWHVDSFLYQQYTNKIHVPLFSNQQSCYSVYKDGKFMNEHLDVGTVWNINNLDMHSSFNFGTTPRVHLIMDYVDAEILEELEATGENYIHVPYPPAGQKMRQLYNETYAAESAHSNSPAHHPRYGGYSVASSSRG